MSLSIAPDVTGGHANADALPRPNSGRCDRHPADEAGDRGRTGRTGRADGAARYRPFRRGRLLLPRRRDRGGRTTFGTDDCRARKTYFARPAPCGCRAVSRTRPGRAGPPPRRDGDPATRLPDLPVPAASVRVAWETPSAAGVDAEGRLDLSVLATTPIPDGYQVSVDDVVPADDVGWAYVARIEDPRGRITMGVPMTETP